MQKGTRERASEWMKQRETLLDEGMKEGRDDGRNG
jgi:hypothetical protein